VARDYPGAPGFEGRLAVPVKLWREVESSPDGIVDQMGLSAKNVGLRQRFRRSWRMR
jgi:hypothetical protein